MKYRTHEGAMIAEISKLNAEKKELFDALRRIHSNLSTTNTGENYSVDESFNIAKVVLERTK